MTKIINIYGLQQNFNFTMAEKEQQLFSMADREFSLILHVFFITITFQKVSELIHSPANNE
jgi:hypothetical protein